MQEYTSRKEAEQSLANLLQKSDPQVLALLYDAYAPVLLGLITRIVRDTQMAEAALQETFLAIWQQRATYHLTQTGLLTWMIMRAKETALVVLQKDTATTKVNTRAESTLTSNVSGKPGNTLLPDLKNQQSFYQLQADEKAVLDLVYLKGCSCTEAAATLGMSEENLKITLRQAITNLRANQL